MLLAICPGKKPRYARSLPLPKHPITEGAECVCVAEISMRPVGIPVAAFAIDLASSSTSRGIIRLSTTTIANLSLPSLSTTARDISRSCARVADRCWNIPLTTTGNCNGVTSTAAAPA